MNTLRSKIRVTAVTRTDTAQELVRMQAVYGDSPENKSFSQYTPSMQVEMTVTNPAAFGFFTPGQEFYCDFTAAPAPASHAD